MRIVPAAKMRTGRPAVQYAAATSRIITTPVPMSLPTQDEPHDEAGDEPSREDRPLDRVQLRAQLGQRDAEIEREGELRRLARLPGYPPELEPVLVPARGVPERRRRHEEQEHDARGERPGRRALERGGREAAREEEPDDPDGEVDQLRLEQGIRVAVLVDGVDRRAREHRRKADEREQRDGGGEEVVARDRGGAGARGRRGFGGGDGHALLLRHLPNRGGKRVAAVPIVAELVHRRARR